jgi:predicted  nucleic acid-binding Zn-ribbon protein
MPSFMVEGPPAADINRYATTRNELSMSRRVTVEQFVTKARAVHGDRYDYSLVEYRTAHKSVTIVCPDHGPFLQRPDAHLHQRQGCPTCGLANRRLPHRKCTDQFVRAAKEKWGDRYDYTDTQYTNKATKLTYRCSKHGVIEQKPTAHIRSGCPFCNGRGISRHTTTTFTNIATQIHGGKYDYSQVDLNRITDYVTILCPDHGPFRQRANNHIHLMNGCPACDATKSSSRTEKALVEFIRSLDEFEVVENDRKTLHGKEIDAFIPGRSVGFEYHGMYWHLETVVGRKRHWEKANAADAAGIQLVQIYEYEWLNKRPIVESKIRCLLGLGERVFARKAELVRLTAHQKNEFLARTHIQGQDGSTIAYGLTWNGRVVACMSFGPSRFNRKYDYELVRYSTDTNTVVVGGASRLLTAFRREHSGSIISYADRRWSKGKLYSTLGFTLDGVTRPSFSYYHLGRKELHSRMAFQKKHLTGLPGYSPDLKEYEIMQLNGYDRLWDAGQYRFVLG